MSKREPEHVSVQAVDLVVLAHEILGEGHVAALECLLALDHLHPRLGPHARDVLEHPSVGGRLVAGQRHELGDVHALVSHPLDVLHHVQQRGDDAQVAGHRRLQGQQRQDALLDLQVAAVDAVVVGDHHRGQLDVLVLNRFERPVERAHHQVEAAEGLNFELGELLLEMGSGRVGHASRPCP